MISRQQIRNFCRTVIRLSNEPYFVEVVDRNSMGYDNIYKVLENRPLDGYEFVKGIEDPYIIVDLKVKGSDQKIRLHFPLESDTFFDRKSGNFGFTWVWSGPVCYLFCHSDKMTKKK